MMPKFTVVIPTYNAEVYLVEALQSIRDQTLTSWHALILDGGSTDATPEIVTAFEKRDSRFKLVSCSGVSPGRRMNEAFAVAEGDYTAIFHADDVSLATRLEKQAARFDHDPELVLLGGGTHFWLHEKRRPEITQYSGTAMYPVGDHAIKARLPFFWCFSLPSIAVRTATVRQKRYQIEESYKFCGDYDWFYRIARDLKVDNLPEILISYRHHYSSDGPRNKVQLDIEFREIRERILRERFPFLSAEELAFLNAKSFEPQTSTFDWPEIDFLVAVFRKIKAQSQGLYREMYRGSLLKEYLLRALAEVDPGSAAP